MNEKFRFQVNADGKPMECESVSVEALEYEPGEYPICPEYADVPVERSGDDKDFYDWCVENAVGQLENELVGNDRTDIELINCTKWGWIKGAWTLKNAKGVPVRHVVQIDEVVDHIEAKFEFDDKIPWPWHRVFRKQVCIWASMIWRGLIGDEKETTEKES